MKASPVNNVTVLGIDLAKNIFQLHGVDSKGKTVLIKRLKRDKFAAFMVNLKPCLVGMEACGGAHHWGRKFKAMGHEMKLMSPQYVKPYVKSNKNDANDAEGCCEAVSRPSMRFVSIKSVEQQEILALHKVRSRLLSERTRLMNQTRGLLAEFGIVLHTGISQLKRGLPMIIADSENELREDGRILFQDLYTELLRLDDRIKEYDNKVKRLARKDERSIRLQTVPGIGDITSTALSATIGNGAIFNQGRDLSAWLGLVPKQTSSGNIIRLGKISKRGNRYIRGLLVHGARSVVSRAKKKKDPNSVWIQQMLLRRSFNTVVVAVANKNARIAWAVLRYNDHYNERYASGLTERVKR
jgi:transposase